MGERMTSITALKLWIATVNAILMVVCGCLAISLTSAPRNAAIAAPNDEPSVSTTLDSQCATQLAPGASTNQLCAQQTADEHQWLTEHLMFLSEIDRASCRQASRSLTEFVWCIKTKLTSAPSKTEVILAQFPNTGTTENIVGCWNVHIAGQFHQDWCFRNDSRYRVTENSGGDVSAWEGAWSMNESSLTIAKDDTNTKVVCDARFSANYDKLVQISCRSSLDERDNFRGIWIKQSS